MLVPGAVRAGSGRPEGDAVLLARHAHSTRHSPSKANRRARKITLRPLANQVETEEPNWWRPKGFGAKYNAKLSVLRSCDISAIHSKWFCKFSTIVDDLYGVFIWVCTILWRLPAQNGFWPGRELQTALPKLGGRVAAVVAGRAPWCGPARTTAGGNRRPRAGGDPNHAA